MNSLKNTRGEMMPNPRCFCVVEDLLEILVSHPPSSYIQRAFRSQLPAEYQTHVSAFATGSVTSVLSDL